MLNRIIPLLVLLLAIVTSEVGSRTVDRSYRGVGSQHPSPWTPALLASPETHTRDICLPVAKLFTSSVYPPWYMSVAVEKCEVTDISQNVPAQKDDEHCPFDGPELHDALALTPSVRFGTPGPYPVLRRSSVLLSLEPRPKPSQTKAVVGAILGLGFVALGAVFIRYLTVQTTIGRSHKQERARRVRDGGTGRATRSATASNTRPTYTSPANGVSRLPLRLPRTSTRVSPIALPLSLQSSDSLASPAHSAAAPMSSQPLSPEHLAVPAHITCPPRAAAHIRSAISSRREANRFPASRGGEYPPAYTAEDGDMSNTVVRAFQEAGHLV